MRLPFGIPDYWTDEQALVVFDFIDEIREQILDHYSLQIQSAARLSRQASMTMPVETENHRQTDLFDDEIPF